MNFMGKKIVKNGLTKGTFTFTAVVSNVGRFDMAEFTCHGFRPDTWFLNPIGFEGMPLGFTVTGTASGIELVAKMPKAIGSGGRLTKLLDFVADELVSGK
jgi:hypothetical protein